MSFYLADKTTSWKHIKRHLYYIADNFYIDLTGVFGKGNEPCEENDKRIEELLTAKKYVSYDEKTVIFSNLSWMKENKMEKLNNLERIRKEKGFSRLELSKLSGVNENTIQRLEKGMYNVNMVKLGTLISLAKALHCKIIDFVDDNLKRYFR